MIWLAWRQFRAQIGAIAAVVLTLLIVLALTWTQVTGAARHTGFTGCRADACGGAAEEFLRAVSIEPAGWLYQAAVAVLFALPVLLGMFWGAPLVARELENGTYRMVFSQSVSRRRWLLGKLAVGGAAAVLSAGLASLVLTRWSAPIDRASSRIEPLIFTARGIVPIAYALLTFVIGVTVGLVLRRTLAAMAVTLLVVLVLLIVAPTAMLHVLIKPVTSVTALDPTDRLMYSVDPLTNEMHVMVGGKIPGAHIISRTVVTADGAEFHGRADATMCDTQRMGEPSARCWSWLAAQNLSRQITYVPGSRFWVLQWREFGTLLVPTLGLSWLALWWIRRRLT
jgi:ABC-type transport system involved in multi-copper enzyme maturation permease subunit